jgi:hypothetical protein
LKQDFRGGGRLSAAARSISLGADGRRGLGGHPMADWVRAFACVIAPPLAASSAAGAQALTLARVDLSERRAQRVQSGGMGGFVVFDGAADRRCHCGSSASVRSTIVMVLMKIKQKAMSHGDDKRNV